MYPVRFEKSFNGLEAIGNAFDFMNLCASACKVELTQTRAEIEAMPNGMENLFQNQLLIYHTILFLCMPSFSRDIYTSQVGFGT